MNSQKASALEAWEKTFNSTKDAWEGSVEAKKGTFDEVEKYLDLLKQMHQFHLNNSSGATIGEASTSTSTPMTGTVEVVLFHEHFLIFLLFNISYQF